MSQSGEMHIRLRSEIIIGERVSSKIPQAISEVGGCKPLIIYDANLDASEYFSTVKKNTLLNIDAARIERLSLSGEPTYGLLTRLIDDLEPSKYDCVISIGGGSLIDIGKGLAMFSTNPGEPIEYRGFPSSIVTPIPHITVPSVTGSGAEASFNAVFINEDEDRKLGINSTQNFPAWVLSDPLLTESVPISVFVSSAVDSLVHSVDSFGSKKANPVTRGFSKIALNSAWRALYGEIIEGQASRTSLAVASVMGIYALMNSGDGPTNGFAYYFGVKNKLPHGLAGGMFLGEVMQYNSDNGFSYGELLGDLYSGDDYAFYGAYDILRKKVSMPTLKDLGFDVKDKDILIPNIMSALSGSFDGNPVPFDESAVNWVLDKHILKGSI